MASGFHSGTDESITSEHAVSLQRPRQQQTTSDLWAVRSAAGLHEVWNGVQQRHRDLGNGPSKTFLREFAWVVASVLCEECERLPTKILSKFAPGGDS